MGNEPRLNDHLTDDELTTTARWVQAGIRGDGVNDWLDEAIVERLLAGWVYS